MKETSDSDRRNDVSIVIPNFNHGAHLKARLYSFIEQTHRPAEIIVVDDASTDDSWAVIQEMAAKFTCIRPYRRERNGGVNAALADGLAVATKTFVVLASADDICLPRFLETSIEMLRQYPDVALVFSDPAEHIDKSGEDVVYPNFFAAEAAYMAPTDFVERQRKRSFRIPTNTVVFRRERLVEAGGFREDLHWHADWFAVMHLAIKYGACYVPGVLCYVRVCDDAYSILSLKEKGRHAEIIAACLRYIYNSDDEVLKHRFRRSALLPQHDLALLPSLLTYSAFRAHMSFALLGWMVIRQLWDVVRPLTSLSLRRQLRDMLNRRHVPGVPPHE